MHVSQSYGYSQVQHGLVKQTDKGIDGNLMLLEKADS